MLTKKDDDTYEWIKEYMLRYGFCPSLYEICEGMGYKSKSTIWHRIKRLEDNGLIIFKPTGKQYRLADMRYVMND